MDTKLQLRNIGCTNCGAELMFDPGTQMTNCNFCGSKFEIEEIEKATYKEVILPDGIIPFLITKDQYQKDVLAWLSEGDYTPDDILTSSVFDEVNGVYLPMYFFSGNYHGNWSASSGYKRTEYYVEWSESEKKNVRRSRTVTDWRPSNGQVSGTFSVIGFAGSSEGIKPEIVRYAHGTKIRRGELKNYDSRYTLGFNLLEFTNSEEDVWRKHGKLQADTISSDDIRTRVPGDEYKDLSSDVHYEFEKTINIYIPYWIVNYQYEKESFYVCMNGSDQSKIYGDRPVDKTKKEAVSKFFRPAHRALGVWFLSVLIGAAAGGTNEEMLNIIQPILVLSLFVVVIFYIKAYKRKHELLKQSKLNRQEILKTFSATGAMQDGLTKDSRQEKSDSNLWFNKEYGRFDPRRDLAKTFKYIYDKL